MLLWGSGGADAGALLRFFCAIRKERNLQLRCILVEHGLRAQVSIEDACFVNTLSQALCVPCTTVGVGEQIQSVKDTHQSLEEKARNARYAAFEAEALAWEEQEGLSEPVILALAQHRDDNVETMLFHLARGTGLDGMRGMPITRNRLVRPFLHTSREEIEEYLANLEQPYRIDSTNDELLYARNMLRHQVLPVLEQVNTQAINHMNQTAFLLGEVADYINIQAASILNGSIMHGASATAISLLATAELSKLPSFMANEVIHLWLQKFMGVMNITSAHLTAIRGLVVAQVGHVVQLPGGMAVVKAYRGLELRRTNGTEDAIAVEPIEVRLEDISCEPLDIDLADGTLSLRLRDDVEPMAFPTNTYTKWFDYDKIKGSMCLRTRRNGDYFILDSEGHHKLLQDYFVNEKVPEETRDSILLFCEEDHVIWIVGHRASSGYFVSESTQRVLEASYVQKHNQEE